jgi:hypothetical protein
LKYSTQPLSLYESRCLLLGLTILSDVRKIADALFVLDILSRMIESACLADLLRSQSNPYQRRRNARLVDFYHRTNYGQIEPVKKGNFEF